MRISCITLNNFSSLPLTRYFIQYFISVAPVELTEYSTPGQYEFTGLKKYTSFARFNNIYEALNQGRFTKAKKYFTIIYRVLALARHRHAIVYTPDFQVMRYAIMVKKLLRRKNWHIIYHQFETIERRRHSVRENRLWTYLNQNNRFIDLLIFPEQNRMEYFLQESPDAAGRSIVFPNTCEPAADNGGTIHEAIKNIPANATLVGHVGNVGPDHYLDFFFRLMDACTGSPIYFLLVGNYSEQVLERLKAVNNPNMILLKAVPHRELGSIYRALDYGMILYRAVDINFKFCAPNKLYEYWSYGIPVMAHQLPGLLPVFNHPQKGRLFDFDSNDAVAAVQQVLQKGKTSKTELQQLFRETMDVRQCLEPVKNTISTWIR
ncbi:MAG: glycosyltransferase [Dinghuibacter sp.]|nr:glycosyltransferase [Dinghuibacter sp.]